VRKLTGLAFLHLSQVSARNVTMGQDMAQRAYGHRSATASLNGRDARTFEVQ